MTTGDGPRTPREWAEWFLHTDHGVVVYVRELLTSALAVLAVGLLLFAVSGLWPPMVAVESSSMNPNMQIGDLVFVMEEHRLAPDAAVEGTGVVTYRVGQQAGYSKFKQPGDVIVYEPGGDNRTTPIIHRAMFYVEEGENWYDKGREVDASALGGASSCRQLQYCPAPYDGFITKGDNPATNRRYDQVSGLAPPVKPDWVVGTAEFRIPFLGNIRLWVTQGASLSTAPGVVSADSGIAPPLRAPSPVEPVGSVNASRPSLGAVSLRSPNASVGV